jgi:hypothetical protein
MSTAECLARATERALQAKDFIVSQGVSRVLFVGSAIALLTYAAISFFKGGDEGNEPSGRGKPDSLKDRSRDLLQKRSKKKFIPERKFFSEEDLFSEDISTSNPFDKQSAGAAAAKRKSRRFMSESDGPDHRSIVSKDMDNRVKEEADDLYFAMLDKLKD